MNRIRELRRQRGISASKLAEMLHITPKHLYDLETGKRRLHEDVLTQLAQIFNVSIDYLLGNDPPGGRDPTSVPMNPKAKRIIDSLARAKELDNEDLEVIADQVERLIEYAKKKKSPKSPPEG